jgi:hypothetical protein
MNRVLSFLFLVLGGALVLAIIGVAFMAYFMISAGENGTFYDGLGRQLYEAPLLIKMLWREYQYPGFKWAVIDLVGFWIGILIAAGCFRLSAAFNKQSA